MTSQTSLLPLSSAELGRGKVGADVNSCEIFLSEDLYKAGSNAGVLSDLRCHMWPRMADELGCPSPVHSAEPLGLWVLKLHLVLGECDSKPYDFRHTLPFEVTADHSACLERPQRPAPTRPHTCSMVTRRSHFATFLRHLPVMMSEYDEKKMGVKNVVV